MWSSPIDAYLAELHRRFAGLEEGEVASYIPELARANPDWFGICIAAADGRVYEVGDTKQLFTIQSISKPFVYGLALGDRGRDAVLAKIGVEPTGDAFNSISLAPGSGTPLNPMINAGAIAATSLVAGHAQEDRWHRIAQTLSMHAGRDLELDAAVYESERDTGHRNRAIAHMLRNSDVIGDDPEPALDLYFRQCSLSVTARDLAAMAATLANGGVNPTTGERVLQTQYVQDVLSVMTTCGMYDQAGEWVYRVGLPAKSGVAGGILAVLPGELGIGVFSPRLDPHGNSVRGLRVCYALAQELGLHFLHGGRERRSAVRIAYSAREIASKRVRSDTERALLDRAGARARVWELQGELGFASAEGVVRQLAEAAPDLDYAVLDLRRVTRIADPASRLLCALARDFARAGRRLLVAGATGHARFVRDLDTERAEGEPRAALLFSDTDLALEWCEECLLGARPPASEALPLAANALCRGLAGEALARLEKRLTRRHFAAGEAIVRAGDAADRIYLIARGDVSVSIELPSGERRRLSTLGPGLCFGELAVVNRTPRSADVRADSAVDCFELSLDDFDRLDDEDPALKAALVGNLLRIVAERVGQLTLEVAALSRHVDPRPIGALRAL